MKTLKIILLVILIVLGVAAVGIGGYFLWQVNQYIVMLLVGIAGAVVACRNTFSKSSKNKGFGITGLILTGLLIILSVVQLIKG